MIDIDTNLSISNLGTISIYSSSKTFIYDYNYVFNFLEKSNDILGYTVSDKSSYNGIIHCIFYIQVKSDCQLSWRHLYNIFTSNIELISKKVCYDVNFDNLL